MADNWKERLADAQVVGAASVLGDSFTSSSLRAVEHGALRCA